MRICARWARWLCQVDADETIFEHVREHGRAIRDFYLDIDDESLVIDESPEIY